MPPVEIPVEASDLLAFTPACLAEVPGAPTFTLRAITHRDQRYHRRLMREEGLVRHTDEAIRDKTRAELKRLWSPEIYETEMARIEAFWSASDEWGLQSKEDPDITFDYDPAEISAVDRLAERLLHSSPDIRRMYADNAEAAEMQPALIVAVVTEAFTNLDAPLQMQAGYLTTDCAFAIRDALAHAEKVAGKKEGTAWMELMIACVKRMRLDGGEEKNSESPSPTGRGQQSLSKVSGRSRSPASEKSSAKTSKA